MSEQLKLDREDFGGFQTQTLTPEEIQQRFCARRFCGDKGHIQIIMPEEGFRAWRILCKRHYVMWCIIQAAILGDPSPIGEGKRIASQVGISPELIPGIDMPQLVDMKRVLCETCGGGMIMETVGMFSGRRFVHTCPEYIEDVTSSV